ncbi:65-kDa microtubule-associated protein 5-like [Carya illinoinensis]|uniref:65-kDa microtubule-associated protein 5 n=1 Tax=Carya illinoinensis TaxID=32201 RepID=A0A8T1NHH1_CARIL|nr:65-kDa microtubule-associated protein 5-like [Carya illinoinensis]KAG6628390.1 hypothetical protein CIPAW_14G010500 [Carya illinoinensis]
MANMLPTLSPSRTTCASLLRELQILWDEIGESDSDRDKTLLQLEQECLDIYRKRVEKTRKYKADLHQSLAEAEAEINNIASALGEHAFFSRGRGTLKEQISAVKPILAELRSKKRERVKEFSEIQTQVVQICAEIAGNGEPNISSDPQVSESDLTVKKLGELKSHLQELQNEKIFRLLKVNSHIDAVHELAAVLSIDSCKTLNEVHYSLTDPSGSQLKSISNNTLARLTGLIHSLRQEKQQRLQKLHNLGRTLVELWNVMGTSVDEQKGFEHVTSLISSSVNEVSRQGCLALDVIEKTGLEVERLSVLKATKMKELVFKRQNELEEIYRGVHIDVDGDAARQILISLIDSGNVDLSDLLSNMEDQIAKAKDQALSRKDILDKVEKWRYATKEEKWLEEYQRDENRYSSGRGAHKNLKRAEKARNLVSKIPSVCENLTAKVKAWEMEKGTPFLYDKETILCSLEEYIVLRQERQEEKRKFREQRRLQEQLAAEQEAHFGLRPTPKKPLGQSTNVNTMVGTPTGRRLATPSGHRGISAGKEHKESGRVNNIVTENYVALPKNDSVSRAS